MQGSFKRVVETPKFRKQQRSKPNQSNVPINLLLKPEQKPFSFFVEIFLRDESRTDNECGTFSPCVLHIFVSLNTQSSHHFSGYAKSFFLEIGFEKGEKSNLLVLRYSTNFGFPKFNISSSSHFCLYFFLLSFVFGMLLAFSLIEETWETHFTGN